MHIWWCARIYSKHVIFKKFIAANSVEYATWNFSKSTEWGMGERYEITNRGNDEEIGHSTHLSRSMDEGNRKKWNIYLSIRFRGRGGENVQLLRTFFPVIRNKMFRFFWNIYVPYQNRTYFWESGSFGEIIGGCMLTTIG